MVTLIMLYEMVSMCDLMLYDVNKFVHMTINVLEIELVLSFSLLYSITFYVFCVSFKIKIENSHSKDFL